MINVVKYPDRANWGPLLERPKLADQKLSTIVLDIFKEVKVGGDQTLRNLTRRFDKTLVEDISVGRNELQDAQGNISEPLQEAIKTAAKNIEKFHAAQIPSDIRIETMPGVICEQKAVPIEKVGLYIPGGTAPLFSTILMLGIPAKLAGCKEIIICTPPNGQGDIDPVLKYTANLIGINKVFKVGGAQAIAAMSFGTESIPKVDKIFGPGNQYVTAAKQQVNLLGTAIDLPAGPSEVLVLADNDANPEFVAADLLSQAEHGADSQVILILENEALIAPVQKALENQLQVLPRKSIAEKALQQSLLILSKNRNESIDLINEYAPEHLILACEDVEAVTDEIKNASSIFLGYFTPESAGDYASGTNHTLPTNGFARSYSGVNMDAFFKKITYQTISKKGLLNLGPVVETMASAEQLTAHKNAVSIRLAALKKNESSTIDVEKNRTLTSEWNSINKLVRPNILNLKPYSSARSEFSNQADVWLDANESPIPSEVNRYPDPSQTQLKEKIGNQYSTSPKNIFLGNGSDEAIDLILRIFCEPGKDSIITFPPTYGMYKVSADIHNVKTIEVPLLENFQFDTDSIISTENASAKVLFICNPNNPTGTIFNPKDIKFLLDNFKGIVVIDQAYIEFSPEENWINRLKEYPRLIILQTFSKAWGAAGLRLGMCFANEKIIQLLNKVKAPYNLSQLTMKYAMELLDQPTQLTTNIDQILKDKNWLIEALSKITLVKKVIPSATNFLLCEVESPRFIYQSLINAGIVVRDKSNALGCKNCLRFTIGTSAENRKLIQSLEQISNTISSSTKQAINS